MGCSTAYHLGQLGWRDVVLIERHELTSGSTWHAAGLVGQLRNQAGITQLLGHSIELYGRLEDESGLATGWKQNGGLRLACNWDRLTELKRQATTARSFGLEMQILTPLEAQTLWPCMEVGDVVGAAFLPTDGQANPSDITRALAKGARTWGVQIFENIEVTAIEIQNDRVIGVHTTEGHIRCEVVVNCCGQWARQFGQLADVNVPLVSVQHQYLITEPIKGITPDLPTLRDPDRLTYYKEEVGGLVMGGYERNPQPWADGGFPENFQFTLLDSNWDHFEPMMELALPRVPALQTVGVKQLINGLESFTPDGNFILGEAPNLNGFFVGAGFNAFGIAAGGGAGKALAEWIVAGEAPYDLWAADIRRFGSPQKDVAWTRDRALELYGKHYTIAWPHEEHASGRPLLRSPLFEVLKDHGACFGEKLGWERPNWFALDGRPAIDHYSFGRASWFDAVGYEHQSVREKVALFDQSSFAKFEVVGPDAGRALNWICSNEIDREPGKVIYTQMLNERGGVECDLTVTRLGEQAFYVVTGTGSITHDFHWITRNLSPDLDASLVERTREFGVLSIMGPESRALLSEVTGADLGSNAFPFATMQTITVAGANLRALRISYVGELGWELHVPVDQMLAVYQAITSVGDEHELCHAGYRAIESLRLEKGYRAWGAELTPEHTPLEAGLDFAVQLDGPTDFLGRNALLRQRKMGIGKRLACFSAAPEVILLGRETIYRDDAPVGWLTSGGYGYSVKKSIGYGYVRHAQVDDMNFLQCGCYELEVASERVPCEIHLEPLYDPTMIRVRQ